MKDAKIYMGNIILTTKEWKWVNGRHKIIKKTKSKSKKYNETMCEQFYYCNFNR